MKRLLLAALLLPLGVGPASAATATTAPLPDKPTDARALLKAMATVEGLEARFTEEKHLALLKAPLVSRGVIYYTRPGHLARLVEDPQPSTVRIGPKSLEVTDASGKQQFDLRSRPDIKMFVESFVHVVAGNYDALDSTYTLTFVPETEDTPWVLTLTPRRAPLSEMIKRLDVRGHGYAVERIDVLETRGDSTAITMTAVNPKRTFTAAERQRYFGLLAAAE